MVIKGEIFFIVASIKECGLDEKGLLINGN